MQMQSNSSYVRKLLYDLAKQMGRGPQDMDPFIQKLEGQWYDTKDALQKLKPSDYARMQIPERLATMIAESVGAQVSQPQVQKMDVESPIEGQIASVKQKLSAKDFQIVVSTLHKIFHNIREELMNDKFKILKKSNQKIAILTSMPEIVKVLRHGGFDQNRDAFVMNRVNIGVIDECIQSVAKFLPKNNFNPYESHVISNSSTVIKQFQGQTSTEYNKMLQDLQNERTKIMSQPIKDRRIRVYQVEPQYLKQFDRKFQEDREAEDQDRYLQMENLKKAMKKQGEEPKFLNRRMQQYNELSKQPVFSETIIRVKIPNNVIFECKCSPMETLQTLVDIFKECLNYPDLDYYLYMTPPVEKLKGALLRKTLYELGCVPRAIFYMKCQQQIKGNLFKIGMTRQNF